MSAGLPHASLLENVRFNAVVIVPNAVQGIFRRRRRVVAAATKANVDGQAIGLLEGMARSYDGRPVWVRIVREPALLLLEPADIARALDGSPDPFAPDPKAKRDGMGHFQPDALTLSRGEVWRNRREFTEAVLAEAGPDGAMAERIAAVCGEELERLVAGAVAVEGGVISWEPLNRAVQRTARRLILGDGAAGDEELTDTLTAMMDAANRMPGEPSEELPAFEAAIGRYIDTAEPGSLVARFADAPSDERTAPAGQVTHWLFALGDTLAINALRALALLAADPEEQRAALADEARRTACLQEAMRLWPTTPMLSRELTAEIEWDGETVAAGTQVIIVNTFEHRNRDRLEHADRYAPEIWTSGEAVADRAFNHLSSGPQGCPGAAMALAVGSELLRGLLERGLEPISPELDLAGPLPQMLDFFGVRVRLL